MNNEEIRKVKEYLDKEKELAAQSLCVHFSGTDNIIGGGEFDNIIGIEFDELDFLDPQDARDWERQREKWFLLDDVTRFIDAVVEKIDAGASLDSVEYSKARIDDLIDYAREQKRISTDIVEREELEIKLRNYIEKVCDDLEKTLKRVD